MEEIRIYHTFWRKELFIAILCLAATFCLPFIGTFKPGELGVMLFLGLMGLFILFTVFRERLLRRPYLTITDECIIEKREHYPEIVIRFNKVKFFERETVRFLGHTSNTGKIIVHLKNGNGFVNIISANGLTMKSQQLFDLLNERLK
jgi:hypothetical protein